MAFHAVRGSASTFSTNHSVQAPALVNGASSLAAGAVHAPEGVTALLLQDFLLSLGIHSSFVLSSSSCVITSSVVQSLPVHPIRTFECTIFIASVGAPEPRRYAIVKLPADSLYL